MDWLSNNLTKDGMEQMVKNMQKSSVQEKNKVKTKEDVAKEWLRLAAFQQKG